MPKPDALSFEEAACLPTAWLTAYRMLFVKAQAQPGRPCSCRARRAASPRRRSRSGRQAGLRMWVTSRDEAKRARAVELGADAAFETGARLPERVEWCSRRWARRRGATRCARCEPGGTLVVAGATSGLGPSAELPRLFFLQLSVLGSTMGTRDELVQLVRLLRSAGCGRSSTAVLPLADAREGFAAMAAGDLVGKVVFTP